MILIATAFSRLLSLALTTLPNVPCPRSEIISSVALSAVSHQGPEVSKLTSISQIFSFYHFVVSIVIIYLFMLPIGILQARQHV
jgi:hypothetical protein